MKILIHIDAILPVYLYGGTERVMWYLGKELAGMGHEVTFLCHKGSESPFASVIAYNPRLSVAEQIPENIDIVHFNNFVPDDFDKKPYIVTYHGNQVPENRGDNAVFVSRNHAARFGSENFVYNGIDWSDYGDVNAEKRHGFFHFLAKASWKVKNVKGAIRIVRRVPDVKLLVLGGTRVNFKMGFRMTFTPKAIFKGMVGGAEKMRLLNMSEGLVFPVLWDEPFGLAITESLYCGCPVFGTKRGSLPELVIPEVGFLSDCEEDLSSHIAASRGYYSPIMCHEYAADNFNSRKMAEEYIKYYEREMNNVL